MAAALSLRSGRACLCRSSAQARGPLDQHFSSVDQKMALGRTVDPCFFIWTHNGPSFKWEAFYDIIRDRGLEKACDPERSVSEEFVP